MRGIAIMSVVVQHLTGWLNNEFVYHKLISISNMAVFFFVSEYIIEQTSKIETIRDSILFLKKKNISVIITIVGMAVDLQCNCSVNPVIVV